MDDQVQNDIITEIEEGVATSWVNRQKTLPRHQRSQCRYLEITPWYPYSRISTKVGWSYMSVPLLMQNAGTECYS